MPKPKSLPKSEIPHGEVWTIRVGLVLAFGLSAFLAWSSLAGGGVPGCGPESSCDKVLTSKWAYLFGLPISLFALPVYGVLLSMVSPVRMKWNVVMILAFLILLSALWFVGIQTFVLRAFCKFCMSAHVAGSLAALMLMRRCPLGLRSASMAFAGSAATVAILAAGQIMGTGRGPTQLRASLPEEPTANGVSTPSATTNSPATFTIVNGLYTLDLHKVPVTGPINAPGKVAKLFDYTCHHCRDLHHLLRDFRLQHSNEVAVVSLPLPLDNSCNPMIKKTQAAHINACEYAKLGLAVFQADPKKFEDYTEWIFSPQKPPELSLARDYAANLVGRVRLEKELNNPAIAAQLKQDIDIYMAAYRLSRSGQLPQMHFEKGASIGAVDSAEKLAKIMADNLGIQPVSP